MTSATPARRFVEALARAFDDAVDRVGMRRITIAPGGVVIGIDVVGETFARIIETACVPIDTDEPPAIVVRAFDRASTGVSITPPPWPLDAYRARDEIAGSGSDGVDVSCDVVRRVFSLYDRPRSQGWWWADDADYLAVWDPGAPLRNVLHWALRSRGLQLAHGAAVGRGGRGILLTGRGGSGKSTTSLSLVTEGWQYVADDYCLLATESSPTAYGLYGLGKADDASFRRFPHLERYVVNRDRAAGDKAIVDVARAFPGQVVDRLALCAVVVPWVDPAAARPELSAASGGAAARALVPSTTLQLPGCDAETLTALAAAVRGLPVYSLRLAADLSGVPDLLRPLLESTCA